MVAAMRARVLAVCVAVFGLLALGGEAIARTGLTITAFQTQGSPTWLIDRDAAALSAVSVAGVSLTGQGMVSAVDPAALAQLATARRDGLRAELLVSNWSSRIDGFSERLAFATLRRPTAIARVAAALAGEVRAEGWNGVTLDIESLAPRDRAGLVAFVAALRVTLPRSATVSVTVSNSTGAAEFAANGYDLAGLGAIADRVILMAYDEHGPWEHTPGPIGALEWQRAGLSVLLGYLPARKVDLGVAAYGYGWRRRKTVALGDAQARALVAQSRAKARYIASVGEWTARLRDGWTIWWSDARSLAARARLAGGLHLHGLAIWCLAQSDPIAIQRGPDSRGRGLG
jgi:spore germination protein YaaH